MSAVGYSPPCRAYPSQQAARLTLQSALEGVDVHNARLRAELKPGSHDDFLLEHSTNVAVAGFATEPLRWSQLVRYSKRAPIRLVPRCVTTQSSGKKRVIDDAAKGGQSALSSDANKLVLCSTLRPATPVIPWTDKSLWSKHSGREEGRTGLMPSAIAP